MNYKPTQEDLLSRFSYDKETGTLCHKFRPDVRKTWNTRYAGMPITSQLKTRCGKRYYRVRINTVGFLVHRVVWMMTYGVWPDEIDHIDGNGLNNSLGNIRNVSRSENAKNIKQSKSNTSGHTGIQKICNAWRVAMRVNKKQRYIGTYNTLEEAIRVRDSWKEKCGYHDNHGTARQ